MAPDLDQGLFIKEYITNLNSNQKDDTIFYEDIYNFKKDRFIPAVRFDVALFLKIITAVKSPKNILEIGFGSGVSALFISNGFKDYENFISLEVDKKRYDRGVELLNHYSVKDIQLKNENSFDFFVTNKLEFDMVFLDAEKSKYCDYIQPIKKILKKGGVLIGDNTIFGGRVVSENIQKRYVKGTNSIKNYNTHLSLDNEFTTLFLDIGDGLSLSIKK